MLRIIAPADIVGLAGQLVGANTSSSPSPFLMLAAALLGSGMITAIVSALARRNSGEARAAAAESVGVGVGAVAQGSALLLGPLNKQVLELTRRNAELETKLASARRDEAERAIKMADLQAEMLANQRDFEERHGKDRADFHEISGKFALAQVDLANAQHEIETLRVQLGTAADRRTE